MAEWLNPASKVERLLYTYEKLTKLIFSLKESAQWWAIRRKRKTFDLCVTFVLIWLPRWNFVDDRTKEKSSNLMAGRPCVLRSLDMMYDVC
jgi:hypothetical protein